MKTTAPYGTWQSDLSASDVAQASPRLAETRINQQRIFWLEGRAQEQGRNVLVMYSPDGSQEDILAAPWSARSKVHEYGGGAYTVDADDIYFVNGACQQVYHLNLVTRVISKLTDTPSLRYGGITLDKPHKRLLAVCEDHTALKQEPTNLLVSIPLDGVTTAPEQIATGHDFYAQCAISPCGQKLAFVTWDHPNMPWDTTQLWLAEFNSDGSLGTIAEIKHEHPSSIFQPEWSSNNELLWVSDASEYWNLYRLDATSGQIQTLYEEAAEFATPLWTLGMRTYGVLSNNSVFTAFTQNSQWQCGIINCVDSSLTPVENTLTSISDVFTEGNQAAFIGASAEQGPAVWHWHNSVLRQLNGATRPMSRKETSIGMPFEFPSGNQSSCFANFYPPCNSHYEAPAGDLPPAIFIGHGGPTGQADLGYNVKIQFWTQRGFAVVDVNYRGSTGFGRSYRSALKGQWGIYDVEDLCAAAQYLSQQHRVHADKLIVRGSSAGGYTVLAALTNSTIFNAGVSLYGIGDLETLATDTHKFETRYLDSLVGPYPEAKQTYIERSPIHKAHQIHCPVILFQGLEDKVVPPSQAEAMVKAVEVQGLPVVYITYAGEGHGFRKAETVINQLESELEFYQSVFKFDE